MESLIDYETRSEIDLIKAGHWRYSTDPSTEAICCGLSVRETPRHEWAEAGICLFVEGAEGRAEVERRIIEAGVKPITREQFVWALNNSTRVVAHGMGFERAITACKFPEIHIPIDRWSCTMARACRVGLPAALEGLMEAIGGPPKDMEGHRVGLQCSKPRPAWKRKGTGSKWFDDADRLARTAIYCARDIRSEIYADNYLPELDPIERRRWLMVVEENTRGMYVDVDFLEKLWYVAELGKRETSESVINSTGGRITNLNSTKDIHAFIREYGIFLENLRKADLERFVTEERDTLPEAAKAVLEGRLEVAKSSIKKLAAIRYRLMADGRVRDLQGYHKAHTGRTTGEGPQPLNLPRPDDVDVDKAHAAIAALDIPAVRASVAKHAENRVIGVTAGVRQARAPKTALGLPEAAAGALRGVFAASPGKKLVVADFAGIETCGLMTVAGQTDLVEKIRNYHKTKDPTCDPYNILATQIYGYEVNRKKQPTEGLLGKQGVLSLGYGSAAETFVGMCAQYQIIIDLELSQKTVDTYRKQFAPKVPKAWWALGDAAIAAVKSPGQYFEALGFVYIARGDWLFYRLPSGKWNYYPGVEIFQNRYGRPELSCLKWKKKQLIREKLYGGLFMENNVQGFCRDLMVEAEEVISDDPRFNVLFTTYDEIIAECDEKYADECLAFMIGVMSRPPKWLPEMPVTSEGWIGDFYKKD